MISYIFPIQKQRQTHQKKRKKKNKKIYKHKPVLLYNWNQPIRHIDNYTLTVIKRKNEQNPK